MERSGRPVMVEEREIDLGDYQTRQRGEVKGIKISRKVRNKKLMRKLDLVVSSVWSVSTETLYKVDKILLRFPLGFCTR